ncbi:MAG: metallophosphoesterase, partial [Deltaproteobacteria bacterium]
MRIAHISDPHLLSFDGARLRDFLSKRWIGGLNLVTNRAREHSAEVFDALVDDLNAAGVDHVVCTGDVTNVALPGEFRFARERFDRIAAGPRDTTVIPGNHDAYVDAGVSLFAELFGDFCASDPGWDHGDWPLVRVRGPVAIVGVTTALQTPWFTAWGRVGDDQLARLRGVLSDPRLAGRFRIVAIHHPPAGRYARHRRHGLRDGDAFCAVLAELGADLVLHGHEHRDLRADIPRPDGAPIPVLGVRSATYAGRRASHRAGYTIY